MTPDGAPQLHAEHMALLAINVWCAVYGEVDGNAAGQAGSCVGRPSNSAENPLHPGGTLFTQTYPAVHSESLQSALPSLSSSAPFKQSSPVPDPPVPELLEVLEEVVVTPPPCPPLPPPLLVDMVDDVELDVEELDVEELVTVAPPPAELVVGPALPVELVVVPPVPSNV